jgi:Ni/Co efflux regulator RcnB
MTETHENKKILTLKKKKKKKVKKEEEQQRKEKRKKKEIKERQAWRPGLEIPAFRRLRQEDCKFNLVYLFDRLP